MRVGQTAKSLRNMRKSGLGANGLTGELQYTSCSNSMRRWHLEFDAEGKEFELSFGAGGDVMDGLHTLRDASVVLDGIPLRLVGKVGPSCAMV